METDFIKQKPYIIAVDFDGVIHRNRDGWKGGEIYDVPNPGCKEKLLQLLALGYKILIHSVRLHDRWVDAGTTHDGQKLVRPVESQEKEVRAWWKKHDLPVHENLEFHTDGGKPWAHIYLDDKALLFCDWNQAFKDIVNRYPY